MSKKPPEDAPAVDGGDAWTVASLRGFERAFWELAEIMQIGAQPLTPKQVWETQMRPTLQRMFAATPAPAAINPPLADSKTIGAPAVEREAGDGRRAEVFKDAMHGWHGAARAENERAEALAETLANDTAYARRIAVALHRDHYATIAPQWEPFDDLNSILSQIDNMVTGLAAAPAPAVGREAVGEVEACVASGGKQADVAPLYALAIRQLDPRSPAWTRINDAITARWPKGLDRVKKLAWKCLGETK